MALLTPEDNNNTYDHHFLQQSIETDREQNMTKTFRHGENIYHGIQV